LIRTVLLSVGILGMLFLLAPDLVAQRVQFPTSVPPRTFVTPAEAGSPFEAGTRPVVGPPPLFDSYSSGSTVGSPPAAIPYSYTPAGAGAPFLAPDVTPSYPQQPGSVYPGGLPVEWQQGSYGFQGHGTEGVWDRTQRVLEKLSLEHTWLYGDPTDPEDFGFHRTEISSTFAVPMFYNTETPLLITPGFASNWLQGPIGDPAGVPRGPDLPPRVYDAYLDVAWHPRISETIGIELGARTGVWTDFDNVSSDSVRILGRGLARVALTPHLDILFGAVYLDRVRIKLLPAGGFYYRPTPEWDMYIVFPNPKLRKHFTSVGNSEWFWYAAAEYGGGSWTVDRAGTSDRIDINDIRMMFGLEWETQTQIRGHIALGYVWDREILFADTLMPAEFTPDDTIMVRGGIDF